MKNYEIKKCKQVIAMIIAAVFMMSITPPLPASAAPAINQLSFWGEGGGLTYAYNNDTYDLHYYGHRNGLYWMYLDFNPYDSYGNTIEGLDFRVINNNPEIAIVQEKNIYFNFEGYPRLRIIPEPGTPFGTYPISLIFEDGFTVHFNIIIDSDYISFAKGLPAQSISTILSSGQIIDLDQANSDFSNAVRFQLKDAAGNILSGQQALQPSPGNYELASTINGSTLYFCMSTSRPSNVSFNFPIFYLISVPGQPYYTLSLDKSEMYNGTRVPSENYTVKVGLNNRDVTETSFTIFDYQS